MIDIASGHKHNWDTRQPLVFEDVGSYTNLAGHLKPHLDDYMAEVLATLGIQASVLPACTKDFESASRKLSDGSIGFYPCKIRDYLRTTLIIPDTGLQSVIDLISAIDFFKQAEETIGYKNEFACPDKDTGFRSLKLHTLVQNPDDPQKRMHAEIIIQHAGMLEANRETAALRYMERRLEEHISGLKGEFTKSAPREAVALHAIRFARKVLHDMAAEKAGLNALIDPDLGYHVSLDDEASLTERMTSCGLKGVGRKVIDAFDRVFH